MALVLAGGQSRRMGRDKALLSVPGGGDAPGLTLLQRTCHIAQGCGGRRTYVLSPWPERYAGLLPASVVLLRETRMGAGPMGALAQGWAVILADCQRRGECLPDWLLVLACDMPALHMATLQRWQRHLADIDTDVQADVRVDMATGAIATLPRHHHRWEPLCGFYHRRCIPSLQQAINHNIHSFQQWLASETVVPLSVHDSNMLRNCNTPAEWQQFLAAADARNP